MYRCIVFTVITKHLSGGIDIILIAQVAKAVSEQNCPQAHSVNTVIDP